MKKILILLSAALLLKSTINLAQTNTQDSLALVTLYDSTNGASWTNHTNWLTTASVSKWHGITVVAGRVIAIDLVNNNLSGKVPYVLGSIADLGALDLDSNQLVGSIPPTLGNLSNLLILALNNNQLTDTIPASLGNLSKLEGLFLFRNQLSGAIPPGLGDLSALLELNLEYNQLSGSIPPSLGSLSNLTELYLNDNQLSGAIPTQLGSLSKLTLLYLEDNQLSDSIPSSLGNLSALTELLLLNNHLSGSIPSAIGNLSNLTLFSVSINQLTGSIPTSFGDLTNLTQLYLDSNLLSGSIPTQLGNLTNLTYLSLDSNQLSGSIPSSIGNLTKLQYLYFGRNHLSGTIPSSLTGLTALDSLHFNKNRFTFNGLEAIATTFPFAGYAPQANIPLNYSNGELSVSAGGTLSNDTFYWFKDNVLLAKNAGDSVLPITQNGSYSVFVVNAIVTDTAVAERDLVLFSDTVTITSLPVKLLTFTATKQGAQARLQWTTANEENSSYFSVERSKDGSNFNAIGQVNALGNSSAGKTYSFEDTKLMSGINYYRLRMVDKDGQYTYSQIRNITNNTAGFAASIYPDPVQSSLNLNFTNDEAMSVQVEIINNEGKVITTQQIEVAAGASTQTINTASLSSGAYYVRCITANGETELKFMK
jgi:Leucine-rich repeat (LRR) protein